MIDISKIDFSSLDVPEVLTRLFYPRADFETSAAVTDAHDLLIPVTEGVRIHARFHGSSRDAPTILFFHGNGEIVSDYDDMAALYNERHINFLPADYRGYGLSNGGPSITNMMRDCHVIFDFTQKWLKEEGYGGPLIVMGRSLGSASALELAAHYSEFLGGLIVESGFATMEPLFDLLDIHRDISENQRKGLRNLAKIAKFKGPTLVIHAEFDHIIPFLDGQALFEASPSEDKSFLKIPGANHNDIFYWGMTAYMKAVAELCALAIKKAGGN